MKLCDLMRPGPSTIAGSDSLGAALRTMKRDRVRYLPVLHAGELVGILSERDILAARESLEPGADWWTIEVRNAMHAPPQTATPDDSVVEAATRMASANIGVLPVVERGHLLGVVSVTDVLDAEVRTAVPPRPAFDSDEYRSRRHQLVDAFTHKQEVAFKDPGERRPPGHRHAAHSRSRSVSRGRAPRAGGATSSTTSSGSSRGTRTVCRSRSSTRSTDEPCHREASWRRTL